MSSIETYLRLMKSGHREAAFHALMELGDTIIPRLADAYRAEANPEVRNLLVEVNWQFRSHASIAFLAEALRDPDPSVWKQALDGLVTLMTE